LQIHFDERYESDPQTINCVLDVTECEIERPTQYEIQQQYYSGKSHCHSIKYEIGVNLKTGRFVWIAGGIPGSVHDLVIAKNSGILTALLPGEKILADKAYVGDAHFITPFKSPATMDEFHINSTISQLRQIVEHTIQRIKIFNCTQIKWRHDLSLHPLMFSTICKVLNLEFLFHPVQQ